MAKLTTDELLDAFKELTLIELSEFVKKFEETFEVTAAAPVAVAAAGAGAAAPVEEVEEKDSFDVVLEGAGEKKIQVIKEVRALTTVRQQPRVQGRAAVDMLRQRMEAPDAVPERRVLPSELVVRASTAAPRT